MTEDTTKPKVDGNRIEQEVKDHVKNFLQFPDIPSYVVVSGSVDLDRLKEVSDAGLLDTHEFPELGEIMSFVERHLRPQGITSDCIRMDNIQNIPVSDGFCLDDFLNYGPSSAGVIVKKDDKEDSLAKLYFMITGIDGEKHFKLIGSQDLKNEKELPRAYVSGSPVMYITGLKNEYLRLVDSNGRGHTYRFDESVIDEEQLGWTVKTAKAAGDRLTIINRKIKKFNETLEGKIIEVEI